VHLGTLAAQHPDKVAVVVPGVGRSLTYGELDRQSCQLARRLHDRGLRPGDHVAVLVENRPEILVVAWAAQRSGLYYTPVNWHLTPEEAAYVIDDCGAKVLFTSSGLAPLAEGSTPERLVVDDLPQLLAGTDAAPLAEEREGYYMFYSSGTTGRPKGIKPTLQDVPFGTGLTIDHFLKMIYGFGPESTYLSTGPLYHAAPLGWSLGTMRNGGTVVALERFDAEECLAAIERHRVTHAQFVPTMFVRMLKLPQQVRDSYDVSSLQAVVHAAAPCPVAVKEQMIDWFGPIVHEYYAGSEGNCFFAIDSAAWLTHKGSVGRPALGDVHITDDSGRELAAGEVGTIWFEGTTQFAYHNDPDKTAGAYNDRGWSTLGDLGHVDEEGYLYLSDRRSDLILTGGVNVYPAEVEATLVLHPEVTDVAVIGVPDDEMGQRVVAVVQREVGSRVSGEDLIAWTRERLAHFKCPRQVVFDDDLPRLPSGKILRREVRERHR
jgi:acyl-CoA synthetase (AMP-forming)/AMP-acid ligase II